MDGGGVHAADLSIARHHAQVVLTKMDWRQDWVLIQTVLYHNGTKLGFQSTGHEVEADNMALTIWREVQEELGNSPIDYAMTYYLNKRQAARLFSELNSLETYEEKQQWMRSQKAP